MSSNDEKAKRKALRAAVRNAERLKLRAALPAEPDLLRDLLQWLDEALAESPCDHTYRHALEFISRSGLPRDATIAWFQQQGGFCDCEVVFNVEEPLEEALRAKPPGA